MEGNPYYLNAQPESDVPHVPYKPMRKRNIWQLTTLLLALLFGVSVAFNFLHYQEKELTSAVADERLLAEKQMKEAALSQVKTLEKAYDGQELVIAQLQQKKDAQQKITINLEKDRTDTRNAINAASPEQHFQFFADYAERFNLRAELSKADSLRPGRL